MQRRLSSSQGNTLGSAVSEAMLKEPALEEATIGPASPGWRVAKLMGSAVALTSSLALAGLGFAQYAYDVPAVATMTDQLQKDARRPENKDDQLKKLMAQVAVKYLDAREWADKTYRHYADPSSDKLLPDLPPGLGHVRTLVLDLNDLLVHSDWTRERGWRVFKRPGVDIFLQHLSQRFEIVVFSDQLSSYVDPILERLDNKGSIHHRLYRDATQYVHGEHVRDLSKLNRPLTHTLYLTSNEKSASLQPRNAIVVQAWKNDAGDRMLTDLMPFLEAIARQQPPDVRDVVTSYTYAPFRRPQCPEEAAQTGEEIPTIYRNRMQAVMQRQAKAQQSRYSGWGKK